MSSHRIGFQAVVLCGPGTSLHPFTDALDLPKALLPIANKPMLHYPLEWCEKAGFDSILVLTLTEHLVPIQSYIRSRTFPVAIQVEAPSSLDENLGTADVLRLAYNHGWIAGDFVVLPCDLVTDLEAEEVVKMWMIDQAGFDANISRRARKSTREDDGGRRGCLGVWYETKGVEGAIKGQETDFLAVAPKAPTVSSNLLPKASDSLNTLLFNLPTQIAGPDAPNHGVPLRQSLLRKHPNYKLLSTRRDSGIYFFPFWVLKFIDKNPKINSIREDLLPWWSKCCWQNRRLAENLGLISILSGNGDTAPEKRYDVGEMSTTGKRAIEKWTIEDEYEAPPEYSAEVLEAMEKLKRGIVVLPIRVPVPKSDTSSTVAPPAEVRIPSITAYLPNPSTAFIRRVDTVQLYLFTSLYLASPSVPSSHKIHASASIDPKASVSRMDCLIAAKVTISEKAVVKRCVLGHGVTIGKGAKLLGCVLMDGASVAEGANLEGCVVGRHAVIGVDAKLKDCQVAEGFFVEEEIQAKNECFVAFRGIGDELDISGLGTDGAYDSEKNHTDDAVSYPAPVLVGLYAPEEQPLVGGTGNESTGDADNQKTDDLEKHCFVIQMNKAALDPEEQEKPISIERVEEVDEDQKDDQDLISEVMHKLEKLDDFQKDEEGLGFAASSAGEQNTESQAENEQATPVKETTPTKLETPKWMPVVPAKTIRWWFPKLTFVWAVPFIGLGIWYGFAKYGGSI